MTSHSDRAGRQPAEPSTVPTGQSDLHARAAAPPQESTTAASRRPRGGRPASRRRRRRAERGSVSAELVVAMPLLLLLILLVAQFALWAHATHIAQAAAAQGLAAARVTGGTTTSGATAADQILAELGQGPLRDPKVAVTRDARQATVHVTGTATAVVPFLHLRVHGEATGPVEIFRPAPLGFAGPDAAAAGSR